MMTTEMDQPVYDEKVKEILHGLAHKKTREELAEEAGNSNWKSIDMYMRRRNFTWDSHKQTYAPKIKPVKQELMTDSSKAGHVLSLLSNEGMEVRTVAERLGFKDHRELAQYMNVRGYVWDGEDNNYVKQVGEVPLHKELKDELVWDENIPSNVNTSVHSKGNGSDMDRFLPLLEMLEGYQDRLLDLIAPASQTGTMPRFIIPGVGKTKTVQMMNTIEQLVVDFSREKNISQRELFEVALIEFFRKYGYGQEVDRLLSK